MIVAMVTVRFVFAFVDEIDGQVRPGIPTYTGTALELRVELADCKNTWVSKGRDFRTECLDQQNTGSAATAQQSYLAGLVGVDSVPLFYELVFGCESLINWDVLDIGRCSSRLVC